jgi:hypothetical protein
MSTVAEELAASRSRLLGSVASLSQEDLDFSPSADRWSAGEILHHVRLVEASVTRVLDKLAARAKETGVPADAGADGAENVILHSLDRFDIESATDRITAPASLVPTKGMTARELLDGLAGTRAALMTVLDKCNRFDLTKVLFPHMVFGKLDGYQWALFAAKHEERHRRQIEKLKGVRSGGRP